MGKLAAFVAAIFGLAILSSASAQTVTPTLGPKPTPVADARTVQTAAASRAARRSRPADGAGPQRLARRLHADLDRTREYPGRGGRRRQGRPDPHQPRLRLLRRRKAEEGRSRNDHVPSGLHLQIVHLDRGHAAGRAGQAEPRRGRQHLPRLQDSAAERQAGHAAQHHDAHGGFRRAGHGPDRRRPEEVRSLRPDPEALGAQAGL